MADGSTVWALGDYPRIARDVLAGLGPSLVSACRVRPGQLVLDVACGSGAAAMAAAEAGASVTASDLTPELLAAGRAEAAERGVDLDWVHADAEDLPFGDGAFDVVMSCIGAMFAPHHQRAADEMLRVCRSGGTIGMINWTAGGSIDRFFQVFSRYAPSPPADAQPPIRWGDEAYVRELFGGRVQSLDVTTHTLVADHFATPAEFCEYYKTHFGPVIATFAAVSEQPEPLAALEREFLSYAERENLGVPGGSTRYEFDYLLVIGRRA